MDRSPLSLLPLLALLASTLSSACTGTAQPSGSDAGRASDGGSGADASMPFDGGSGGDASTPSDGGTGADASAGSDAGPQVPPAPTGLSAAPGDSQVALSWNASAGATSYRLKRAASASGPFTTVASPTSPGHLDTALANGVRVYYVVSAVGPAGESPDSLPVAATPSANPQCFALEICGNQIDDDCDGQADEPDCANTDTWLADWKNIGQVVDYVVFGTYPLYQETQANRDLTRQTWGARCVGQTGSAEPQEESTFCLGASSDFIDWKMTVPAEGEYALMLADIRGDSDNPLQIDRGGGLQPLPDVDGPHSVVLLDYGVGAPPRSLFYLLHLPAGRVRLRLGGGSGFLFANTAVLARLKEKNHYYPSPTYPHVHFTAQQVAQIKAGPLSAEQQAILTDAANAADSNLGVATLAGLGRDRQEVLEALTYSGVLNGNAAHLAKALDLFQKQVAWLAANDGDYASGDILMFGYDLRQLGTCYDQLAPHFPGALGAAELSAMREQMSVEMMRHALSNLAGNWWRLPRQGGWTGSHAQGGKLGLTTVFDDKLARFYFDVSLLMYKTTLRDNVSQDGAYLQALGSYYGWDMHNLVYFLSGLANNPGVTSDDLWTFNGSSLRKYYQWLLYSLAPTGRCMGPFGAEACSNAFYGGSVSTLQGAASHYGDGAIQWLHDKLAGPGHTAALIGGPLVESLSWATGAPSAVDPAAALPLGKVTRGNEHLFMRTGWAEKDFAFMSRCGLAGNHDQREQGAFILYADGHNYAQAYNNYEADTTELTSNRDKNLIAIDDRGQAATGAMDRRMAQVTSFVHGAALDYAACDNAAAYNANPGDAGSQPVDYSTRRTLLLRPAAGSPGYFVMLDRIKAQGSANHRYKYQVHPGCRIQNGQSSGTCVDPIGVEAPGAPIWRLSPPGSQQRLTLAFAEPAAPVADITAMPISGFPNALNVRAGADQPVGEFATVLFPEDLAAGRAMPAFARLAPAAGQAGFTLGGDTLLWSKDGSAIDSAGIASDAAVAFVRGGSASPTLVAMLDGTRLAVGGAALLTSSARSNAAMRWSGGARTITAGNDMAAGAAIDLGVGGLTPSASYACAVDGVNRGRLTADGSGRLTVSGIGPGSTTVVLTP